MRRLAHLLCWWVGLWGCVPSFAQVRYVVDDIATLYAVPWVGTPSSVNNLGHMTGDSKTFAGSAFFFDGVSIKDLGTLGGDSSWGVALNNSDQIVGGSTLTAGSASPQYAFLYRNGVMQNLGLLPGGTTSVGVAINDSGAVIGKGDSGIAMGNRGILFQGGNAIDIGTLGGASTQPTAINNLGQIVGQSALTMDITGAAHAFLYQSGSAMMDLGTLGGKSSMATGINDVGQVTGWSNTGSGVQHAFLYQNGAMTDLGVLGTGLKSQAVAINNRGEVVGDSLSNLNGGFRSFIYRGGTMKDLSLLVEPWVPAPGTVANYEQPYFEGVQAINDQGQILVGSDRGAGTAASPRLLTPVTAGHILNFSLLSGNLPITIGFYTLGQDKQVLLRGVGASLQLFGITTGAADPALTLFSGIAPIGQNDNWDEPGSNAAAAGVRACAFPLLPGSKDAALAYTVHPGGYTFQVSAKGSTGGTTLAELYDADFNPAARFVNTSALFRVDATAPSSTAGLIIGGNYGATVLIRAVGPGLAQFGISNRLTTPQFSVFNSQNELVATNAGWAGDPVVQMIARQMGAFDLSATSADAALVLSLKAGAYTIQVSSTGSTGGTVLLEVYEVQ